MSKFIKTYRQAQENQSSNLRERLKDTYLNIIGPSTLRTEKLPKSSLLFIVFHSLFLDQKEHFKRLLQEIQKEYTFINYSEATEKLNTGKIDKRYACISADDGFKNFMDASFLFDELGIHGMVFINSHLIEEQNYDRIVQHCRERLLSPPMEFLTWKEVEDLRKRGHEIGNHGWKHKKLTEITKTEIEDEVYIGKEEIEKKIGAIKHYAYTYGRAEFINKMATDIIFESGHKTIGSAIRGQHISILEKGALIKRELIEPSYPLKHMRYFVEKHRN